METGSLNTLIVAIPWPQIWGAIAGGVVGGFSGFVANMVHRHREQKRQTKSIGSALAAEIGALCAYLESRSPGLDGEVLVDPDKNTLRRYYSFRGERDYMSVFRSLGASIGYLPEPLPKDLVYWYTGLAICLERARELHELSLRQEADWVSQTLNLAQQQKLAFQALISQSVELIERLSNL